MGLGTEKLLELYPIFERFVGDPVRWIQGLLSIPDDRMRTVLLLRMGLFGRNWTYREIGELFKVTTERVRQIEHKAYRKLEIRLLHPGDIVPVTSTHVISLEKRAERYRKAWQKCYAKNKILRKSRCPYLFKKEQNEQKGE